MDNIYGTERDKIVGVATFSVVIPAYNVEPYLARCLDSVIPALAAEDEVILSLENSADASNELAEQYAQRYANVRTVHHDVKGPSEARNSGVREARGTYIIYVDGDDRVDTELFKKVLRDIRDENGAAERPDAHDESTPEPRSNVCDERGTDARAEAVSESLRDLYVYDFYCDNQLAGRIEPFFQIGAGGDFDGIDRIQRILGRRGAIWNVWRHIFRREFLQRNNITFQGGSRGEDISYMTSVLLARPVTAFRHDPYYIYTRYRGGSLMNSRTLQSLTDVVGAIRWSICRMKKAALPYSPCFVNRLQREYIMNMAMIYELPEEDRAAGKRLYEDAREVLEGSSDLMVKLTRLGLRVVGVDAAGYMLHLAKSARKTRERVLTRRRRSSANTAGKGCHRSSPEAFAVNTGQHD